MTDSWSIDEPTVVDIDATAHPAAAVSVRLVAGRVDVVVDPALPAGIAARVEVSVVRGRPVEIRWDGHTVSVGHSQRRVESFLGFFGGRAPYDDVAAVSVAVPVSCPVDLATVSADGLVSRIEHPVAVHTVSGDVALDGVRAAVTADSVSGALELRGLAGTVTAKSVSGDLTVHAVSLSALRSSSVSGEVNIDLADVVEGERLSCTASAKTVSGSVTVRLPAGTGFEVSAATASGQVVAGGQRQAGFGRRSSPLRYGSGGLTLAAHTVSGDVTVLHAERPATPAADPTSAGTPADRSQRP